LFGLRFAAPRADFSVNFLSSQIYFSTKRLNRPSFPRTSFSRWPLAGFVLSAGCLGGCAPTINLATPQPVKVDIGVRLDVYQKTAPTKAKDEQSNLAVAANRRLRSGEIQQLKNDRVVGEDRDGYLDLRTPPKDPKYLAYAKSVVESENADRSFLYLANAQAQSKPVEIIEGEYAKLWSDRAFPGEWVQKEDGTWNQK
jgi:uncharacterized protein YdbL (DUF1318 family)